MSDERGYIYRVAKADTQRLQSLITNHVGSGWTFGGAAQWDFDPNRGSENLRPLVEFPTQDHPDLAGDFGHAFSQAAEVRWKRRDDGDYDVLILSEQPQTMNGATPLCIRHWNSKARTWDDGEWIIRRPTKAVIRQTEDRSLPIHYIDYVAPNGAVQFQRLVEVKP